VRFEEAQDGGFIDMVWPSVCIFEMKRPSEADRLDAHRAQALRYWQRSGTARQAAPPYVVLCAFHRFEVWQPGAVYTEPRTTFDLAELPENLDALAFLAGREPLFVADQSELTREAVVLVTDLYDRLRERRAADAGTLRDFVLQAIWSMFAEDLRFSRASCSRSCSTRWSPTRVDRASTSSVDSSATWPSPRHGPSTGSTQIRHTPTEGCSRRPRRSTSSPTSSSYYEARVTSTGSVSSRRSSAPSYRGRSGGSASGRSARTTPPRPTSSRLSSRPSSSPGASG